MILINCLFVSKKQIFLSWKITYLIFLVLNDFDFGFSENGLTAYRLGKQLVSQVFINN